MPLHPLCNEFSLQSGTKSVAIFNMVAGGVMIFFGVVQLILELQMYPPRTDNSGVAKSFVTFYSLFLVSTGVYVILSCVLFQGAKLKNLRICQAWLVLAILGTLVMILQTQHDSSSVIGPLVILFLQGYCLWIVWTFIQEMKMERESGGGCISES